MDATNGDILCMASMPCFDPNSFSDGISHTEWDMMAQDERHPLINKVLQGLYPPGSTCKPMMTVALQKAGIDPEARINCQRAWRFGNATFHCSGGPHGPIAMEQAIVHSCDIYFYQMAMRAGVENIAPIARQFGMGERFELPFPSQRFGTWPDPAWLQRRFHRTWQSYDTINMSIGQGYVLVNPLQQAVMIARLISGRKVMPRILAGGPAPAVRAAGRNRAGPSRAVPARHDRRRQRRRHRQPLPAAGTRIAGGQDRHRPGPPHLDVGTRRRRPVERQPRLADARP